jgi:hypothetical protein
MVAKKKPQPKSTVAKPKTKPSTKPKTNNSNKDNKDKNYWENLAKEFKQFNKARGNANNAEYSAYYDRNLYRSSSGTTDVNRLNRSDRAKGKALQKESNAKGQLLGALLQGRRYNTKTNKQVKKKK